MQIAKSYIQFFKELSVHNHKDWFDLNRQRYEEEVKAPFYLLVENVIQQLKEVNESFDQPVKNTVFRINKDVRFSKDKSPYKLHMAASVSTTHKKDWNNPDGIYFQLSAEGLMIGGGLYMPDKLSIQLIREAMKEHSLKFIKLIENPGFKKKIGEIHGEQNKLLPLEFKNAALENPLIYNKQFYFWKEYWGEKYVTMKNPDQFIVEHYLESLPFIKFLSNALNT